MWLLVVLASGIGLFGIRENEIEIGDFRPTEQHVIGLYTTRAFMGMEMGMGMEMVMVMVMVMVMAKSMMVLLLTVVLIVMTMEDGGSDWNFR